MNVYGLNTQTKINAAAGTTPNADYYDPSDSELWAITFKNWRTGKESVRVITFYGASNAQVGEQVGWTFDQTNRSGGTGRITGIRRVGGSVEGVLPTKSLPLHVMK